MNDETQILSLNSSEDTRKALLNLLQTTQRYLHLYTPYVDPRVYDDAEILEAIRTQVTDRPRLRLSLLLPPAHNWRGGCPRLLQLTERLSSATELRTPPRDEPRERPEFAESFMIADGNQLLHLADPRLHIGRYQTRGASEIRALSNFFIEIWEKSQPDLELRRLRL